MIEVTRLNGEKFYINVDQIEYIENNPDTLIYLKTGNKVNVKESAKEVVERTVEYKRRIYHGAPRCADLDND